MRKPRPRDYVSLGPDGKSTLCHLRIVWAPAIDVCNRTRYTLIYLSLVSYTGKEATGWAQEADLNPTLSHSDTKAHHFHPFTPQTVVALGLLLTSQPSWLHFPSSLHLPSTTSLVTAWAPGLLAIGPHLLLPLARGCWLPWPPAPLVIKTSRLEELPPSRSVSEPNPCLS